MEFQRVTVEMAKAAFKETGFWPVRNKWQEERGSRCWACLVTALAAQKTGEKTDFFYPPAYEPYPQKKLQYLSDVLNLPVDYVSGLIGGFDGEGLDPGLGELLTMGWEDGSSIAAAMFPYG